MGDFVDRSVWQVAMDCVGVEGRRGEEGDRVRVEERKKLNFLQLDCCARKF